MQNQAYIFFIFILNGFFIGLLFDIFRIFRRSIKTTDFVTNIEDILFWILVGISLLFTIFKFNNGDIRAYIFLGLLFGAVIYILVFSRIFMKISLKIINFITKLVSIIIIKPITKLFQFFKNIIFGSFSFIFINLNKIYSNLWDVKKCKKKEKMRI